MGSLFSHQWLLDGTSEGKRVKRGGVGGGLASRVPESAEPELRFSRAFHARVPHPVFSSKNITILDRIVAIGVIQINGSEEPFRRHGRGGKTARFGTSKSSKAWTSSSHRNSENWLLASQCENCRVRKVWSSLPMIGSFSWLTQVRYVAIKDLHVRVARW